MDHYNGRPVVKVLKKKQLISEVVGKKGENLKDFQQALKNVHNKVDSILAQIMEKEASGEKQPPEDFDEEEDDGIDEEELNEEEEEDEDEPKKGKGNKRKKQPAKPAAAAKGKPNKRKKKQIKTEEEDEDDGIDEDE